MLTCLTAVVAVEDRTGSCQPRLGKLCAQRSERDVLLTGAEPTEKERGLKKCPGGLITIAVPPVVTAICHETACVAWLIRDIILPSYSHNKM